MATISNYTFSKRKRIAIEYYKKGYRYLVSPDRFNFFDVYLILEDSYNYMTTLKNLKDLYRRLGSMDLDETIFDIRFNHSW